MQRVRERVQEVGVDGRRQVLRLLGVEVDAAAEAGGDAVREVRRARLASREAKIVPKIATPKEPPTERKNVAVEVATPISCGRTSFWTTSTSTCMTRPIPTPTTSM